MQEHIYNKEKTEDLYYAACSLFLAPIDFAKKPTLFSEKVLGFASRIETALKNGADPNITISDGMTFLTEVIAFVIQYTDNANTDLVTTLAKLIKTCIDNRARPNLSTAEKLLKSCDSTKLAIVIKEGVFTTERRNYNDETRRRDTPYFKTLLSSADAIEDSQVDDFIEKAKLILSLPGELGPLNGINLMQSMEDCGFFERSAAISIPLIRLLVSKGVRANEPTIGILESVDRFGPLKDAYYQAVVVFERRKPALAARFLLNKETGRAKVNSR